MGLAMVFALHTNDCAIRPRPKSLLIRYSHAYISAALIDRGALPNNRAGHRFGVHNRPDDRNGHDLERRPAHESELHLDYAAPSQTMGDQTQFA